MTDARCPPPPAPPQHEDDGMTSLIDQIRADREAGTPAPWRLGSWLDNVFGTGSNGEWLEICRVTRDNAPVNVSRDGVDARRIARVPDLEAAYLASAARIERLEAALRWYEDRRLDAIARSLGVHAPEDAAVLELCRRHGFGAVIDSACRQWARTRHGKGGAFFVGGCIGDTTARDAIAKGQDDA